MTTVRVHKKTWQHAYGAQTAGSLAVQWTTHRPRGLSNKDVAMAECCDRLAKRIGSVEPSDAKTCGLSRPSQS